MHSFNQEVKNFLNKTQTWAKNMGIPYCPALFLWVILRDETTLVIAGLDEMNVDIEILIAVIKEHLDELPKEKKTKGLPQPNNQMQAAIDRAVALSEMPELDVLFIECLKDPSLNEILMNNAIDAKTLRETIDILLEDFEEDFEGEVVMVGGTQPQPKKVDTMGFLEPMGIKPVKIFGREKEIAQINQILMHRIKKNPILLGEPGVGKTAIVEAIACGSDKRFFSLNTNAMVSGTIFRGQFEERMEKVVKFLKDNPDVVLFIDEAHTIVNAGNSSGDVNLMNVLKPPMARGEVQIILSTTLAEYRMLERDKAFVRRCQKVSVGEPSAQETLEILKASVGQFERHHGVKYSQGALETLVEYAEGLMGVYFPDKAFDIVDSIGAAAAFGELSSVSPIDADIVENKSKRLQMVKSGDYAGAAALILEQKILMQQKAKQKKFHPIVDETFCVNWIRQKNPNFRKPLDSLVGERLKSAIVGQDSIIDSIIEDFSLRQLDSEGYPTSGNYLFMGNTSMGKTELAKQLAKEVFGNNLFVIDSTEYQDRYSVHRLIGADPGLIGYEEGGKLIEWLKNHPNGVILVDEIEKAHESLHDLMLQMTGDGRITDNKGFEANLKQFMIIFTSNSTTAPTPMGYGAQKPPRRHPKVFKPEFMSRIDMVFEFADITPEQLGTLYERMFEALAERILKTHGVTLEPQEDIKQEVLKDSQNPRELKANFRKAKRKLLTTILDPHASVLSRHTP